MAIMRDSEWVEQTAAEWLAKKDGERWQLADEEAFNGWLTESVAHRVAYVRLAAAWRKLLKSVDLVRARSLYADPTHLS
jgi:ferric-dicitrate binding protein FerR (iron transport regulator)